VQRAPGIPNALFFRGQRFMHNSGAIRAAGMRVRVWTRDVGTNKTRHARG
jgi:hypothetical protein